MKLCRTLPAPVTIDELIEQAVDVSAALSDAIAGEASLVVSVEDVHGPYRLEEETTDPATGEVKVRLIMSSRRLRRFRLHPPAPRGNCRASNTLPGDLAMYGYA